MVALEEYPRCLQPRVMERLRADPLVLSLRELSPQFYQLAIILFQLIEADDQVKQVLQKVCRY